jgi:hypothetical protein
MEPLLLSVLDTARLSVLRRIIMGMRRQRAGTADSMEALTPPLPHL